VSHDSRPFDSNFTRFGLSGDGLECLSTCTKGQKTFKAVQVGIVVAVAAIGGLAVLGLNANNNDNDSTMPATIKDNNNQLTKRNKMKIG
jgi:hypothetical protein